MTEGWKDVMDIDDMYKTLLDGYRKVILAKMNSSNAELMRWGTNLKRVNEWCTLLELVGM